MSKFVGLNIGIHDSSAAIVEIENRHIKGTNIYLSERLSKIKHQGNFPFQSLRLLKKEHPDFWDKIDPGSFAVSSSGREPKAIEQYFATQNPLYHDLLKNFGLREASLLYNDKIHFVSHHLAHAYSIWPQCPFEKALVIVSDGMGTRMDHFPDHHPEAKFRFKTDKLHYETLTVYLMENGNFTPIKKNWTWFEPLNVKNMNASDGLGAMFASLSKFIFGDWNYAGKVMGLSAYGKASPINDLRTFLHELPLKEFKVRNGKKDFDQMSKSDFQFIADLSATVQAHFEKEMIELCHQLKKDHPEFDNLILIGGCALNCLLNSKILDQGIFKRVFVPPFPNDEGVALGAAVALLAQKGFIDFRTTEMKRLDPALGAHSSDAEILQEHVNEFKNCHIQRPTNLIEVVSDLLAKGKIVAWIQGRSEVGPRALGHRSILVRPDRKAIKSYLNDHIKFREDFRPYGATILKEETTKYFEVSEEFQSPFMTFAPKVREEHRKILGDVIHVDGTSRLQTLLREQNPRFYDLIQKFQEKTGLPILLNTSLNIMGQPILEDLKDAVHFFEDSKVDVLVFQDYVITK